METIDFHFPGLKPQKSLAGQLLDEWATQLESASPMTAGTEVLDPVEWIETNFLIDRPRDPANGDILPRGPIRLADYQRTILREALRRGEDGKFIYSTIVWSEPKKSGKTAVAAAVGLYMAATNDACYIYCLANDGKQSLDRIYTAMASCMRLHNILGGMFAGKAKVAPSRAKIDLGAVRIEAIPCDAEGEAGSEPLMTIWSELWGYAQKHKERIWTELTIPPTLYGYALRWVESYAGYEGESTTLWNLYAKGVKDAKPHPDFPDLPLYVNERAGQLTFWSHEPRQPWQTQDYYDSEAEMLTPTEFRRVHKNEWVSSTTSLFDDIILWDRCGNPDIAKTLPVGDDTPVVIALDAGYVGDCAAAIMVSRHPDDPWDAVNRRVVERGAVKFKPEPGEKLNFSNTLEPLITRWCKDYNVFKVVYDPYQLHKMCTDMKLQGVAPFEEFSQAGRRLQSDRQLYDMVIHRHYIHSGDRDVREHVMQCAKKEDGRHMRFVKKNFGDPIDLIVATSMAVDECLRLNV